MKKAAVLAVLAVVMFCSSAFAFFDPVSTILDIASKSAVEEAKSTPSPAFLKLVDVFNMVCEKQIEPNQIKVLWKNIGGKFEDIDDAGITFKRMMAARKADDDVKIMYCWNTDPTYRSRLLLGTEQDLIDNINDGCILYAHLDDEKFETQTDLSGDVIFQLAMPIGLDAWSLNSAMNKQTDYAIVVTGMRNGKALAQTPEGEKEMEFSDLMEISDFIMVFDSPTWQERRKAMVQETQEKSELEAYMEQLKKEVKNKKE